MVKANIETKNGLKIVIEGTTEEITRVLSDIKRKEEDAALRKSIREKKKKSSATDFILKFKDESFFNKPKTLVDIKKKLAENGLIYPVSTLSGILIGLVKRRELGRIKVGKVWGYVKR